MTSPTDPNGPSLENIHPPKCTCGAAKHTVNKEVPRFHYAEPTDPNGPSLTIRSNMTSTTSVDRLMEEAKQLHMWAGELADDIEDLQDGDMSQPKRLSTINDILAVLKLLVQKV